MRQVFTSPRLENVEAVAEMLRAEGIEVKISNQRSYRGNRRRAFSYRDGGDEQQAAVWIVRADDQPRGRQLLRDAGLLDSSREGASSYLSTASLHGGDGSANAGAKRGMRLKLGLLVLIGLGMGLIAFALHRSPAPRSAGSVDAAPPSTPAPPPMPEVVAMPETYRADVPTALAALLIGNALDARKPERACVSVDGHDPAAAVLASLPGGKARVFAQSACPEAAMAIAVSAYMTDGSGSGSVQVQVDQDPARSLQVRREGSAWQILPAP